MKHKASPGERYLREMTWEEKAQRNPLYGVMSVEDFVSAGPDPTPDQLVHFFEEGRRKAACLIQPFLAATATPRSARILEFGCGMGRLLKAVRSEYPDVVGVDVSRTMVERATTYVRDAEFRVLEEGGHPAWNGNGRPRVLIRRFSAHQELVSDRERDQGIGTGAETRWPRPAAIRHGVSACACGGVELGPPYLCIGAAILGLRLDEAVRYTDPGAEDLHVRQLDGGAARLPPASPGLATRGIRSVRRRALRRCSAPSLVHRASPKRRCVPGLTESGRTTKCN